MLALPPVCFGSPKRDLAFGKYLRLPWCSQLLPTKCFLLKRPLSQQWLPCHSSFIKRETVKRLACVNQLCQWCPKRVRRPALGLGCCSAMIYHHSKSLWYFLIAQPWSVQDTPCPQMLWLLHYLHFFQLAHGLWPYFAWALLRASCEKGRPEGLKNLQTSGPRGWDQPIDCQRARHGPPNVMGPCLFSKECEKKMEKETTSNPNYNAIVSTCF